MSDSITLNKEKNTVMAQLQQYDVYLIDIPNMYVLTILFYNLSLAAISELRGHAPKK